jgi:hypothetical protein
MVRLSVTVLPGACLACDLRAVPGGSVSNHSIVIGLRGWKPRTNKAKSPDVLAEECIGLYFLRFVVYDFVARPLRRYACRLRDYVERREVCRGFRGIAA